MKRLKLLVVLVVSLLINLVSLPNPSPAPGEQRQPEKNTSSDKGQKANEPKILAQTSPPANVQQSAPISNPNVQQPSNQPSQPPSNSGGWDWMLVFTFALVVVGATQAVIYYRQAKLMREGLEINREATRAAQQSADAATMGAGVAESALELTEGADVVVGGWEWGKNFGRYGGYVDCILNNNGRTRACVVGYYGQYLIDEKPEVIFSDYRGRLRTDQEIIIPARGSTRVPVAPGTLPEGQAFREKINNEQVFCGAFIYILYEDVFGDRYELAGLVNYVTQGDKFNVTDNPDFNFRRKLEPQKK